jgi:hypothetical protein
MMHVLKIEIDHDISQYKHSEQEDLEEAVVVDDDEG